MALVSFETVAAAAEAISKDGGKPSVRSVIAQLGGGSPNSVLPLLNEWKAGRVAVRSSDIELDPRIGQIIAELVRNASDQAARSAEERAADVQADAETVAEAGREAESLVQALENQLAQAHLAIAGKERALEDVQAAAGIEAKNSQDRITALQQQLDEERDRADLAVQAVAKAEVRLELIPGLQSEIERLKPFEQQAAVLTANLEASRSVSNDLQGRLAEALADSKAAHADLEKSRGAEQSLRAKLDAALHEIEGLKSNLVEVKRDLTEARHDVKDARAEAKEARAEAGIQQQKKGE
ncbi:Capsule polysaccharide export protein [Pseudomonas amygdali pv. mori]|uniref:Capsule polysaccharide export protein n=1 Tax=Pseudomonas amygdali pv. mori TaxID=34065 RepID=A0A3M5JCX3_PSEA0|nr:DNA-binding protein [Pseudomonas amygdali]RMT20456.1 Capsule polysaccharide export protein [Pseudomonas amygdali pv. mori]